MGLEAQLTAILTYIGLLSICAERVADGAKHMFKINEIENGSTKAMLLQVASGLGGGLLALIVEPKGIPLLEGLESWKLFVVTWLMSSGGSSMWHSVLTSISSFKK